MRALWKLMVKFSEILWTIWHHVDILRLAMVGVFIGSPVSSVGKESAYNAGDPGFVSWVRKICWRRDRLPIPVFFGFPCGSALRNPPAIQESCVQSLGWEDPLEKGKANHPSILAWRTPRIVQSRVARSRTWLSDFGFLSTCLCSYHYCLVTCIL